MNSNTPSLEEFAEQIAGNWRSFESFGWHRLSELDDPDNWGILYTHHRDSPLLDLSNAQVTEDQLERFEEDVVFERHAHWACGWIDGFSIRVYQHDQITAAFAEYFKLHCRQEEYPILDEHDYAEREYLATLENIRMVVSDLAQERDLPEQYEQAIYRWLSEEHPECLESLDDQGASLPDRLVRGALAHLWPLH